MTQQEKDVLLKQIDQMFDDPKYKKNLGVYPEFREIVKFVAIDYDFYDVTEILKNIKVTPFNRSAQIFGVDKKSDGTFVTTSLGCSSSNSDSVTNKVYKERSIFLNQYYEERDNFDFEDFGIMFNEFLSDEKAEEIKQPDNIKLEELTDEKALSLQDGKIVVRVESEAEKRRKSKFDEIRREEITSGNKILEDYFFGDVEEDELEKFKAQNPKVLNMDIEEQIAKYYNPRVRLKQDLQAKTLREFFYEVFEDKNKKGQKYKKIDLYERKTTLLHEFLHAVTKRYGFYHGGVNLNSRYYLHEGMTEWLTVKTLKKHPEFFFKEHVHKIEPFPAYAHFVSYVEMMNQVFPGSIKDVYFGGKIEIQKYKKPNFSLREMIDNFKIIELVSRLQSSDLLSDRTAAIQDVLTVFEKQKEKVQKLKKSNYISTKKYDTYLKNMQICYDKTALSLKVKCPHNFKEQKTKEKQLER